MTLGKDYLVYHLSINIFCVSILHAAQFYSIWKVYFIVTDRNFLIITGVSSFSKIQLFLYLFGILWQYSVVTCHDVVNIPSLFFIKHFQHLPASFHISIVLVSSQYSVCFRQKFPHINKIFLCNGPSRSSLSIV